MNAREQSGAGAIGSRSTDATNNNQELIVNESNAASADFEQDLRKEVEVVADDGRAQMNRMKQMFSREKRTELALKAKDASISMTRAIGDMSQKSFVSMQETFKKMQNLSIKTGASHDEGDIETEEDENAKKRVERGIRASTTEKNEDVFLDVEDNLKFLGYADGENLSLAKVTVMKWSVMFPRCLAVGREDGTIRICVFGKSDVSKTTTTTTMNNNRNNNRKTNMTNNSAGNDNDNNNEDGNVAKDDNEIQPPPPTTEIALSDDDEGDEEYVAHGVSHVFELTDVFSQAVSDLDWSLDGSSLLACSSKAKEIRMYKLHDNNNNNNNNNNSNSVVGGNNTNNNYARTKYHRAGNLEAVVQISENPTSVKIHPVRTNLALITTKQRSVMLADVNSTQAPDRVRVQGDPQAGLREICFNTSGRLAYFGDETGRVFTLSCIERKDFTKKFSMSKLLGSKGKKISGSNNSGLAKQTDPTSKRIKEEKEQMMMMSNNSMRRNSSSDLASKDTTTFAVDGVTGSNNNGDVGDATTNKNNDEIKNQNDADDNIIIDETASKKVMNKMSLKQEEFKDKANVIAKRMKDEVKDAMNKMKTYAKEKATKPSQGFSLTVLDVNSLGQERSPVCALFWCAYVASINAPVLAVACENGKVRLLRITDLGASGDHLVSLATASMPSFHGGFSFCPAKVSTAPPMIASPRERVTGLICEILQTPESPRESVEQNFAIKQVLETREDDTFFSDGEDDQAKPKTPALAFCAESFSFSGDGLRLAGSNSNGKVAIWSNLAL